MGEVWNSTCSTELNKPIENTVHDMVNAYKEHLKNGPNGEPGALPTVKTRETTDIVGPP